MRPILALVLLAGVWNLHSSDRVSRSVNSPRIDWHQFRGPNGSGVGEGRNLPIQFGPAKNVLWRMSLPAGVSSPVLAEDRLIVTASEGRSRFVICLNRHSGSELWRKKFEAVHTAHRHPLNDPASPSPLTDGTNTYAFFPDFGLVSLDAWKNRSQLPAGASSTINDPNQNPGVDGLPRWTKANRSVDNTDLVLWYVFAHNHVPRPEDWPVMPVASIGFMLKPDGFFVRNPALDLPAPSLSGHPKKLRAG